MDFNEYMQEVQRTSSVMLDGSKEAIYMTGLGLMGEVGEYAEIIKKGFFHGHPIMHQDVIEELGDILWYWTACCKVMGIDPLHVINYNIQKLHIRYPNGFDTERSINR